MTTIITRLDLTQIFCEVDDFCQDFQKYQDKYPKLPTDDRQKQCTSRLCVSEVMTITIGFHGSGYRNFKEFYLKEVLQHWIGEFPNLVSYNRFVELMPLIARCRKNMKNRLMLILDRILLRKRAIIESVNDQLKNICQIEHTRHRSPWNFLVNLLSGLVAYTYHPVKPSLD